MKVVGLSDHPGEMLDDIHSRRQAAAQRAAAQYRSALAQHQEQVRAQQEAARARHEAALAQHSARLTALRQERDHARAGRRWWRWIKAAIVAWHTHQHLRPRPPAQRQVPRPPVPPAMLSHASDQEAILAAGMTGEQTVATELGAVLGDEWVLLRGYRNRRGEIDHILLGPRGLFAIEVKHRNATVDISGDQWRFRKYDRYGNLVEEGWITDRRGRSPSVQLNEPAAELERFLSRQGHSVRAQRVVILSHPRSALGDCRDISVDLVATSTSHLSSLLGDSPAVHDPAQVAELQRLIVRDHHFHQRR
ncbi:MAG: nuclease-related domain-containing protein [Streptosporangiaceae bacterium]